MFAPVCEKMQSVGNVSTHIRYQSNNFPSQKFETHKMDFDTHKMITHELGLITLKTNPRESLLFNGFFRFLYIKGGR